jgi:hypothetical protein
VITICTNTPIPDLEDLREQVNKSIEDLIDQFPSFNDVLEYLRKLYLEPIASILPTIRNIIYEGYSNITQEINEIVEGIKHYQDIITMGGIFEKLVSVIGGVLDDLIPPIPILNIPFTTVLKMDAEALYDAVKQAIINAIDLPFITLPLFEGFRSLAQEVVYTVKTILIGYKNILINTMKEMISQVLEILEIVATLPSLLVVPTAKEVMDAILDMFPEYKSIVEVIKKTGHTVEQLLNMTQPNSPSFKEKFIAFYSNTSTQIAERVNQTVDYISSLNFKMLVDFIKNTLKQLGIEFPVFCFTLGVSQ